MASNLGGMPEKVRAAGLGRAATRTFSESAIGVALLACALVSVFTTFAVVFVIAEETFGFFREVSVVEFLTSRQWTPLFADQNYGISPLVIGTLMVTAIASVIGLPLGLGCAVYLSEFASDRARRTVTPILFLGPVLVLPASLPNSPSELLMSSEREW